ncbi:MAG: DEAD/DEAH box helicase family protein [Acidimicrobiales bacterium]|nr:DEAD/DEAH box helicase family protein [Acidimicrobiales bacterium]
MAAPTTDDPAAWIAENSVAFAIRDPTPLNPGHTVVLAKAPLLSWWDATSQQRLALLDLVDKVKRRLDAEFSPDGYIVSFSDGLMGEQRPPRLRIHVVPHYSGDIVPVGTGMHNVVQQRLDRPHAASLPGIGSPPRLVTPFNGQMKLELLRCLINPQLDRIDLLVSFIMRSGLDLIAHYLDRALDRGADIRLLTTDYLNITDSSALAFFLDRTAASSSAGGLQVRVFSDDSTSFHPKAYLFWSSASGDGVGFVGSSNLSRSGIAAGIEWNIETHHLAGLVKEFERLWNDPRALPLTADWLKDYSRRHQVFITSPDASTQLEALGQIGPGEVVQNPTPSIVQSEALAALEATRLEGHGAGLVVMATGLGKTWLAAFDSTRPEFDRVLFVAHREEILRQARDVYRRVRPSGDLTLFTGSEQDPTGDVVFATVQSLHRNLERFDPEAFDYIVIDEFHHAAAVTYRGVLSHFRSQFVLGLTATPDRADAADLLALCSDNLVYECGLREGIELGLLCPFTYHTIPDVADYQHIPWRGAQFDLERLSSELATIKRAEQVFAEWEKLRGRKRRTLGFCCTIAHAEFMADHFRSRGISAVAVHSGAGSAPRELALEQLARGELRVIFTVDLFNEGVDVPEIDVVLFLRPTESPVVFFQQLGRGLRRAEGKPGLDVIDLVGNHKSFLLKARLLAELAGASHLTNREAVGFLAKHRSRLEAGSDHLPEGCSIVLTTEVIDLFKDLAGPGRQRDRLREVLHQWVNDHQGTRPSALELSLAYNRPLALPSGIGWFDFLDTEGLLKPNEAQVVSLSRAFLYSIERGSYTKSYKLVTLRVLARARQLRLGMGLNELATLCRWEIMRDPDLRADLADVAKSFNDPNAPTSAEWFHYWIKNPIAALTRRTATSPAWFHVEEDRLVLNPTIPDDLGATFDALVEEIVEYRLHRYLVQRRQQRMGERRSANIPDPQQGIALFTNGQGRNS